MKVGNIKGTDVEKYRDDHPVNLDMIYTGMYSDIEMFPSFI